MEFRHLFALSAPEFKLFGHYVTRYIFFLLCRFCTSCCAKQRSGVKFCWKCGLPSQCPLPCQEAGPNSPKTSFGKPVLLQEKPKTKSFEDYMACKKKQQQSGSKFRPKKKVKVNPDELVTINIGQMRNCGNDLKPIWGKRLPIQVTKSAGYARILSKGMEKWAAFDRKFDPEEDYMLLFEDGSHAVYLPGQEEDFELEKYKTELGKDYKRITMYLCTTADFEMSEDNDPTNSELSFSKPINVPEISSANDFKSASVFTPSRSSVDKNGTPPLSCDSPSTSGQESDHSCSNIQSAEQQILEDSQLAEMLQQWENTSERLQEITNCSTTVVTDPSQIVKILSEKVDRMQEFFLVSRRCAPFSRTIALWQRQARKSPPTSVLKVHFNGEAGIDTGAMSQEFLAEVISDMGREMFLDGSPTDSTYYVQNGTFRTCGEIVAVSLAQGGPPPPCFLEQCVYESMSKSSDMISIEESDLTTKEQQLLNDVSENCNNFTEMIFEHGYTGVVDDDHIDEILRSLKVSLVNRRPLYMREFLKGMATYGLAELILKYPSVCQPLFVSGNFKEHLTPDANYLFSLMDPQYSPSGSTRRRIEEDVMDHFQDCLNVFEDGSIIGHSAAVAWNYKDANLDCQTPDGAETFENPDLTVAGVMGWLTGQKHKPIDNQMFKVTVYFNHDCLKYNPKHRICFPTVGACGKEITIPVAHMSSSDEFKELFVLAFCKGQAFAKP